MDDTLDFSRFEPTFRQRSGRDRFAGDIAKDRAILMADASAWAKTPDEARLLAIGMAKARHAVHVVHLLDQSPPYDALLARVYPAESILALAGKAAAKKALLELASRSTADSPWFGIACSRILSDAFRYAQLIAYGFEDSVPETHKTPAYECESTLKNLGDTERSISVHGARAISSRSFCPPSRAPLLAWALGQALGAPALELTVWAKDLSTEEIASHAATWNATRMEAALIGAQAPLAAPAKAKARL